MQPETRRVLLLASCLLLTGCRVGVSVFEGGDVVSASGERHCFEGGTCEFDVGGPIFSETFIAKPRYGYEFIRWRSGEGFLCANSTDPECTVTLDGSTAAQAIASTGLMGYLMPEFTCTGECPERPNYQWQLYGETLEAMNEARDAIAAYVAANGEGAPSPELYGVSLTTRNSYRLHNIDILPANATLSAGTDHTFYIVANLYTYWDPTPGFAHFALSGQTNSDNTMEWTCIPNHPEDTYIPNGPGVLPEPWLPFECRG